MNAVYWIIIAGLVVFQTVVCTIVWLQSARALTAAGRSPTQNTAAYDSEVLASLGRIETALSQAPLRMPGPKVHPGVDVYKHTRRSSSLEASVSHVTELRDLNPQELRLMQLVHGKDVRSASPPEAH